jgi:Oxidoreductase molybdopterin binding domain
MARHWMPDMMRIHIASMRRRESHRNISAYIATSKSAHDPCKGAKMNSIDTTTADLVRADADHAGTGSTTGAVIFLEGDFQRPLTISVDELRRRPVVHTDPFNLRCFTTNRFIRSVDSYRGPLLRDLILQAGLPTEPAGVFKRMVFIAVGHDDYAVTFSWHELFNTPVGERVIVALECGDQTLQEEQGAPILFSGSDVFPAPRHIKRLARVIARVLTF